MSTQFKSDEELMQEFEAKQKAAKEANKTFDGFFLFFKEDERAIVHPLLNIPQATLTEIPYHEKFDRATNKMVADNVCSQAFGGKCRFCELAEAGDKKMKAQPRLFLPVYVHGVWKPDVTGSSLTAVTFKDEAGKEQAIKGVRMLKLNPNGEIWDALKFEYYEDEFHNIQAFDFTILRTGTGLDTKYKVQRRQNVLPMPEDVNLSSVDKVISDVRLHREEETEEGEKTPEKDPFEPDYSELEDEPAPAPQVVTPAQPGAVPPKKKSYFKPISATAGEVTTTSVLDSAPASPKQYAAIGKLAGKLDRDVDMPETFGEAQALIARLEQDVRERRPLNGSREVTRENGVPVR